MLLIKSLLLWAVIAQGADIATTEIALRKGCTERFYPMKTPWSFGLTKGGAVVAFTIISKKAKIQETKVGKGVTWGLLASGVAGAVWNLHQMPKC